MLKEEGAGPDQPKGRPTAGPAPPLRAAIHNDVFRLPEKLRMLESAWGNRAAAEAELPSLARRLTEQAPDAYFFQRGEGGTIEPAFGMPRGAGYYKER